MSAPVPAYSPRWAAAAADIAPRPAAAAGRTTISFAYGLPDPALFPTDALAAATELVLRQHSDRALQYGSPQGLPQLVRVLLDRLNRAEGLELVPEECIITSGASQGIGLVARALLDPGDAVVLETPAWPGVINILRRYGARMVPVPLEADGLDVSATAATLAELHAAGTRPKLLYTVPTFQNPTGITMTATRRQELLALAREYDLLVVEDDAYRDLAFDHAPPPSLLALDDDGRVLRLGTYSKILAAGMRLGWMLGPRDIISRMVALKDDGGTSPFASYVAAAYTLAGELEPHITQLLDVYRLKRDTMLEALKDHFPPAARWTAPGGGFFVWVTLPPGLDSGDLLARAREEGVDFLPGRSCFPDAAAGAPYLRLAFSLVTVDQIEDGIKRLGRVIESAV
ncbi:MAG TPA: PLP-dependent aminotransferase family protein [Chloroflexia bacterium]|nr:PLP-dependent aminotransferase family protein [Chloroflexia bacterium]